MFHCAYDPGLALFLAEGEPACEPDGYLGITAMIVLVIIIGIGVISRMVLT